MLLPALVDFAYNNDDYLVFIGSAALCAVVCSLVAVATQGVRISPSPRLGFVLVTGVWLVSCIVAAVPLYLASINLTFADAFFESVSGLTTTGATVISHLDDLPRGILLWRSLLNWLGGIGIVGMVLLILPSLRVGGLSLFQLESSDKSDKILPRVQQLASGIVAVYLVLTIACAVAYAMLGMSNFDAVNHAMSTVATGGFSTHDASLGYFNSDGILLVAIVFMILGALPFVLYIRFFMPRQFQRWADPQIKIFLGLCVVFSLMLTAMRMVHNEVDFGEALISSTFNLVSIITTTGFISEDFTRWSHASAGVFFIAMFIGGCAGSTSGGIKVNRIIILFTMVQTVFGRLLKPHSVQSLKYGHRDISIEAAQSVAIFFFLFMALLLFGTGVLAMLGLDFLTAFSGALTAVANNGPGFGEIIGPAGNFAAVDDYALWVLSFLMVVGRLEIVTVLILLSPVFWRTR
ncbi:TrkH family potassium uptake protein [Aureimonas fodinaquatilis]|uniref:Trk system potassium uptake protein n=1 Tax=Aureimonas fodinaquatilis TaxID=2565783 RepID=A0A5B0E0Q9_9HYPH|nr:TrkH family potassium uptake protein [Aureimonas fodinaquatilis]KAA0972657.1 TrkH family potassium uptake protein [Aureimonas fodinaquatilis]